MRNKLAKVCDPNSFVTCSGDEFQTLYDPIVERDGTITLKPSGKLNIPEFINSFKEQTDISFVMKKLSQGDFSVLNSKQGMYGDFTSIPNDPAEVLQFQINAERYFMSLPRDVRDKFDNSVTVFLREGKAESEKFFSSLGVTKEQMKGVEPDAGSVD